MKECMYLQQQPEKCSPPNNTSSQQAQSNGNNNTCSPSSNSSSSGSMPCWYFDKKELRDTASIQDGITFETERRYRKEGARFIMNCGTQMGLGHNTMATGVVYFHRFYMFHSFKSFPRYVTACCCLFLAGKVEETPKKCRDIIKAARGLLTDNHFYSFGEDPKEEVMTLERILLQTIKFDLQVEHPYTFLLKYAKCFKGDQQKLQKMVQMAWNFVNDSLSTVVCLQWEPEIIAVALIHLASKLSKFTVVDWVGRQSQHVRWWDMFVSDVTMEILEDICHQVLDLYQSNQKDSTESQSPPQKPPSRADSPTPMKSITNTSSSSSGSPAAKAKPPNAAPTTPVAANIPIIATVAVNPVVELNNIQSIKSLANAGPTTSALPPPVPDSMSAAAIATTYHMYAPPPPANTHPHQLHGMYGTNAPPAPNNAAAPPPLPPPMSGYGGPVAAVNAWPAPMSNAHYANAAPPPPMPPGPPPGAAGGGGGGSYYQGGGGGGGQPYGRQQRY